MAAKIVSILVTNRIESENDGSIIIPQDTDAVYVQALGPKDVDPEKVFEGINIWDRPPDEILCHDENGEESLYSAMWYKMRSQ